MKLLVCAFNQEKALVGRGEGSLEALVCNVNVPRDTETLASARMSLAAGQHWRGGGQGSPGSGSRLLTSPPSTAHICMQQPADAEDLLSTVTCNM